MADRSRETSREEDYRDYEERDLEEGWPYADLEVAMTKRNEAYGAAPAGFDGDGNPGSEITGETAIRSHGGPVVSQRVAHEAIDDDALEEEIYDQLSNCRDVVYDQITVTVRDGVAKLTGDIETVQASAVAAQLVAAVPGVRAVYNLLVPIGLDSHIPADATD